MAEDPREDRENEDPESELRDMLRGFLEGRGDIDPAQLASAAGLGADPAMVQALMAQLQQAFQRSEDGIDWSAAGQQAQALASRTAIPSTPGERSALEQALHVAALWLDEVTEVAALTSEPELMTRSEWAVASMPVWTQLAEPVASSFSDMFTRALEEQLGEPDEASRGMVEGAGRLMRNMGGTMYAMQLGQVVGQLAGEAVSGGDIGIPLLDGERHQAALVTQNVRDFGADLDIPADQVAIYLAVRELAHARLFRHAKWLRLHLLSQITESARGLGLDLGKVEEMVAGLDPSSDMRELQEALQRGDFITEKSEEQLAALGRLETMLALIEGWVDTVTAAATTRLPKADAIAETVRRRRASGGPAESAFAKLVGLELRPRRLREAAAMWQAVTDAVGGAGRDALWAHPDIVPTAADVDDPGFLVTRLTAGEAPQDDIDRALEELLGDDSGERPSGS
ncbi:zinc-dependent metalloprotease [Homoserinibacter sp. YIM 151385]|uniref:zinc-dependent metalloprotease n=1 Tax=Homoserinibacter sp. YIM 151385 TaxID=2985506 RepID=UPI0022F0B6DB|nr:zinc-dependent metalloprotease [Homoserinibacter sp. YIM 151385]WBU38156.1 zinc-dependent metalloprotease [Homoserinibacter sp. YIM 151385]